MADTLFISKITLPSGTQYEIKDAYASSVIKSIVGGNAVVFVGVSTTAMTDGGTEKPTVDDSQVNPSPGQLFFYGTKEFIWGKDNKWHELGSLDSLGKLAYQNSASGTVTPTGSISQPTFTGSSSTVAITATDNTNGNYQPKGTISQPTFTGSSTTFSGKFTPEGSITVSTNTTTNKTAEVSAASSGVATYTPKGAITAPTISVATAGSTTTIKNPTSINVAMDVEAFPPGMSMDGIPVKLVTYYSVNDENLSLYQLGYATGPSITTTNVTVKNGDATYTASAPDFIGIGARLVTGNIAVPNTYTATFTGTEGDVSTTGMPKGSVSQPTFTGTKTQLSGTTTAAGTVSKPTFTGDQKTVTVS